MKSVQDQSFGIVPVRYVGGRWEFFLILHKKGDHWAFPKGHKEEGETPLQAAMRELKEETSLVAVHLLREEPFIEKYQFYRKDQIVFKTVEYFLALAEGTVHLQKEEIRDGQWFASDKVASRLSFKEARAICEQIMSYLKDYVFSP